MPLWAPSFSPGTATKQNAVCYTDQIWSNGRQVEQHDSELPGVFQRDVLENQQAEHYSNPNVTEQKHREGFYWHHQIEGDKQRKCGESLGSTDEKH